MNECGSLPAPIVFGGNWSKWASFIETLHQQFENDFVHTPASVGGVPVIIDFREDPELGKQETFWHVVTRGSGVRTPEVLRAERINWIRPILENCDDACVTYFRYQHKPRDVRHYLWLQCQGFVVILKEVTGGRLKLITSFCQDVRAKEADLQSKYANRLPD